MSCGELFPNYSFYSFYKVECQLLGYQEKIKKVLEDSIEKAEKHRGKMKITAVETIGGNTRIPFVQNIIKSVFNMKPFATVNADEVIAHGCGLLVSALGI